MSAREVVRDAGHKLTEGASGAAQSMVEHASCWHHSVKEHASSATHRMVHGTTDSVRFLTDALYREDVLSKMRETLRESAELISQELDETGDMGRILQRMAESDDTLTEDEKEAAKAQLLDICKVVPALGVFLLPGGAVLLPVLVKILPFDLLPSAFCDSSHDELMAAAAERAEVLDINDDLRGTVYGSPIRPAPRVDDTGDDFDPLDVAAGGVPHDDEAEMAAMIARMRIEMGAGALIFSLY